MKRTLLLFILFILQNNVHSQSCNNWLKTQLVGQSVKIGDLDVVGNQMTVEAEINRIFPYVGTYIYAGDIVSKHAGPPNANYLLRPNNVEITTTNGYFITPPICNIELNKTYHIALVYNGTSLKFYRNGFLMSQVAATGDLFQNDLITTIGDYAYSTPVGTNFLGYINEVRIWNVARSQVQIKSFMNIALPSPTTQPGLLAYYTFDGLLNKQGNSTWNGTLTGAASINNTNPNCILIADSCQAPTFISNIINDYTPVLSLGICTNTINVVDAAKYNVGDTVLIIQMQGAVIDSTNTAAFGTITDYKNAGNYEFNYIKTKTGNAIELKNNLTRQYDLPNGKVQLIRVPYYNTATISSTLTCLPWDGSVGGVLAFNVKDTLDLQSNIDVSGKGFLAGVGVNQNASSFYCFENNFFYPSNVQYLATAKGTGITTLQPDKLFGKGAAANAGGGGNSHNSGGGGGANGNAGGFGGYQFEGCGSVFDNRGIGGKQLAYSNAGNKIFMGGSGGSGHANNPTNFISNGGNGGGIIIVQSGFLQTNSNSIIANGGNAIECGSTGSNCHEGMGGGGAGGTILTGITKYIDNASIQTKGGKGGDMTAAGFNRVGPGGGGGAGVVWFTQPSLPPTISIINSGGINGVCTAYANDPWGTTPGSNGLNLFNLSLPIDLISFKKNIDSVRIKETATACKIFDFKSLEYINTNPVIGWQWFFGDGATSTSQNTAHTYTTSGTYNVKLVATDANGCKDSTTKDITINLPIADAGIDTSFCSNLPVTRTLQASGGGSYAWTPSIYLDNSTAQNPVATITASTRFYLTVTNALGCQAKDSITLTINANPTVKTLTDTAVCKGNMLVLNTTPGILSYQWSPGIYLSDSTIGNPVYKDTISHTLYVTGINSFGCKGKDTINIFIKSLPFVKTINDSTICKNINILLSTSGAQTYLWSPATGLSNPNISSPFFVGTQSQTYAVTGTAANGCKASDTIAITVKSPLNFNAPPDNSLCKNSSVRLNGNNGNAVDYLWSPAAYLDNASVINPVASPGTTTIFNVTITDKICNTDSIFSVLVTVNPLPVIVASKSNDLSCAITSALLGASGAQSYSWSPAGSLNDPAIATPIAKPAVNTIYLVTGTDLNGCKNKDSVTVLVKLGSNNFVVPNAFTPNGDGINDCFSIKYWGEAQSLIFIIYSRWGEKMFETNTINTCWDGKFKGQPSAAGNYVYYIKAKTLCGEFIKKGNVILIR